MCERGAVKEPMKMVSCCGCRVLKALQSSTIVDAAVPTGEEIITLTAVNTAGSSAYAAQLHSLDDEDEMTALNARFYSNLNGMHIFTCLQMVENDKMGWIDRQI